MYRFIFNKLLNEWGMHKMTQVITVTLIGAGAGYLIGSIIFKSEPEQVKEKDYEDLYDQYYSR